MPFDGSGNFVRNNGTNVGATAWQLDRDAGTPILSSRHDTHDEDIATGLENCVTRDGQNAATADLPMGGFIHTGVGDATAKNQYPSVKQIQNGTLCFGGVAGGTANALTASLSPAVTAYVAGMTVRLIAGLDNSATATLNLNAVGATTIKKIAQVNTAVVALDANDITKNMICEFVHDGTNWILINPSMTGYTSWTPTLSAGGSMTYGTTTINYAKYWRQGKKVYFIADFTGTVGGTPSTNLTMTLPVTAASTDGMGGACKVSDGTACAGYWDAATTSSITIARYDSANWSAGAGRAVKIQAHYEAA